MLTVILCTVKKQQLCKLTMKRPPSSSSVILTRRSLLLLTATSIYIIVIGTQFKLANIISTHHERSTTSLNPIGAAASSTLTSRSLSVSGSAQQTPNDASPNEYNNDEIISLAHSISQKWNLTAPTAPSLLIDQFHKPFDYDPHRDFFHFHHLYKSGGTSMSDLMDKTIGLPKVGEYYQGILPGSYRSGDLNHEEALKDIQRRLDNGSTLDSLPYKAAYAHTGLRPVYGPEATKTGQFYLKYLPSKRLRVVTMLRDPLDFRASNHAMIMCGLNHEVEVFNKDRVSRGLEKICTPEEGLNVSALIDVKIEGILRKCDEESSGTNVKGGNKARQSQCKQEREGIDTLEHCRSPSHLLKHAQYEKHYRSMFKGVMGRFHKNQNFGGTAYGRMGYGYESAELSKGYSVQAVEEYTLQDLGGLDLSISGAAPAGGGASTVGREEPDFVWFGITERMKESVVLFYYTFRVRPVQRVPKARVQDCRPTCEYLLLLRPLFFYYSLQVCITFYSPALSFNIKHGGQKKTGQ
jgi:hypothetical protein